MNYHSLFTVVLENTWTIPCKIELKIGRRIGVEATVFLWARIFIIGLLPINHTYGKRDFCLNFPLLAWHWVFLGCMSAPSSPFAKAAWTIQLHLNFIFLLFKFTFFWLKTQPLTLLYWFLFHMLPKYHYLYLQAMVMKFIEAVRSGTQDSLFRCISAAMAH